MKEIKSLKLNFSPHFGLEILQIFKGPKVASMHISKKVRRGLPMPLVENEQIPYCIHVSHTYNVYISNDAHPIKVLHNCPVIP